MTKLSRGLAGLLVPIALLTAARAAAPQSPAPAKAEGKQEPAKKAGPKADKTARPRASEPKAAIAWMDWGSEAFRKAILRERPILLNVVVSWSRQCRAMEATWADPRVISIVNERFVPIKVDADRRPDLRDRYPSGTWPAVTLLLPNGVPFYAGRQGFATPSRVAFGLLPPEKLAAILEETAALFRDKATHEVLRRTVEEGQKAEAEQKAEPGQADPAGSSKIFEALKANFDALNGGWTVAPKFPMTAPIEAALFHYSQNGDEGSLTVAERALNAVTEGPLFDKVDGGLHRLASKPDWSQPEYEKLLDRNVAVLENLLSAFLVTGKVQYADRATSILRYLQGTLRRPGGGFFASQSADPASTDGGDYYRASASERKSKKAPPVSDVVLVGWSAKAAAAEVRAGMLLQQPEWLASGRQTLDWLLATSYDEGRGVYHALAGEEKILPAYLEDQALFAEAMLDAYQLTGDKAYLKVAEDLASFMLANLRDPEEGLFGDIIPNPGDPALPLRKAMHSYEANSRVGRILARVFYLNPQDKPLRDGALAVLEAYAGRAERGPSSALYGLASAEYHDGPLWGWVVGNPAIGGYTAMLAAAHSVPALWRMIVTLDPADPRDAQAMHQLGLVRRPPPAVYFSRGARTSVPARFPREVLPAYKALVQVLVEEQDERGKESAGAGEGRTGGAHSRDPGEPAPEPDIRPREAEPAPAEEPQSES